MRKFFKSLFTDKEWDADSTKVMGWIMVVVGFVGFFLEKNNFQWLIVAGGGLITSGKFSSEG